MGESGKNFSASQNRAIRGLNIGAGFRDYKSRQQRLQIMEILGISNRDKKITNRRSDYKLVQNIRNYQNLCSSRIVNFSQLSLFFFLFFSSSSTILFDVLFPILRFYLYHMITRKTLVQH